MQFCEYRVHSMLSIIDEEGVPELNASCLILIDLINFLYHPPVAPPPPKLPPPKLVELLEDEDDELLE